jgi:glutamate synthase (ferredoxin)
MSGGMAYVYDPNKTFPALCNKEMVDLEQLSSATEDETVTNLLRNHVRFTQSPVAQKILDQWKSQRKNFVKVIPKDYKTVLQAIETAKRTGVPQDQAIMEASSG